MAGCARISDLADARHHYLIALGSNRRHRSHGAPAQVIGAAIRMLDADVGKILAASPIIASAPVGPSIRQYANAAGILEAGFAPLRLLGRLKSIERTFGPRRGQRWSARVLDLDIILWSGGFWATSALTIPHPLYRERDFVTGPAAAIAPDWRDPVTGLTNLQLNTRLTRPRPLPSGAPGRSTFPRHRDISGALSSVGRATDF
ncbi:2-amino-4-hydroxy-6-hydroxymethyldihydropteridine diphosphokinase [Altererythrobacter aquiaggeris]|uniref:2-amino-4-hydroxy-6- hydroxymethyldihydropteridine diphosphokinase n=1 Tax=Aestuarierythrobacter aquiaggeris TaxID=1898396 RepID=UPI00301721AE